METVAISAFKARCLAILERVRKTGRAVLVTRRGVPVAEVVPPSLAHSGERWLGGARGTGKITGDVVAPIGTDDWEVLRS